MSEVRTEPVDGKDSCVSVVTQPGLDFELPISVQQLAKPAGYSGLYAFHKYWGKKPAEIVSFLVERLSDRGEVVCDPFLGFGAIAREASLRGRKFIGCDLNPAAAEIASLLVVPPQPSTVERGLRTVESCVRADIDNSYLLSDDSVATHYLWYKSELRQVWRKRNGGMLREEFSPTKHDLALIQQFDDYTAKTLRPLRAFRNSRINSPGNLGWRDLFSGRALRNLELLHGAIVGVPDVSVRRALLLALTASAGQMSKMVFAIENRGKTSGTTAKERVEVGSWVIGFWRPELHFEVNVWNCFANKAESLLRGLRSVAQNGRSLRLSGKASDVLDGRADVVLATADAHEFLAALPDRSVDVLVTDPPHGDRVPYLELSEIWNAILAKEVSFDREIVVSDARERGNTPERYAQRMTGVLTEVGRLLSRDGRVAIMFNSRSAKEWRDLATAAKESGLKYVGCFPMTYSANSVIQDSRAGALKYDYVLVFGPPSCSGRSASFVARLQTLPNWTDEFPDGDVR